MLVVDASVVAPLIADGGPDGDAFRAAARGQALVAPDLLRVEVLSVVRRHLAAGFPAQRASWPDAHAAIAAAVRTRTRDEWAAVFDGTDACVAPILSLAEAARHPHNVARGSFITVDGVEQNAPAPRFSRTPAAPVRAPHRAGADTEAVLRESGFTAEQVEQLRTAGALA